MLICSNKRNISKLIFNVNSKSLDPVPKRVSRRDSGYIGQEPLKHPLIDRLVNVVLLVRALLLMMHDLLLRVMLSSLVLLLRKNLFLLLRLLLLLRRVRGFRGKRIAHFDLLFQVVVVFTCCLGLVVGLLLLLGGL
jgi:hypothetical protein